MRTNRILTGVAVCCALLLGSPVLAAERQVLRGHVPAVLSRLRSSGRLSSATNLDLAIGLPLRHPEELTNLLQRIYDPASLDYRHYLTPAQFTGRFGPTESDYLALIAFAKAHGFTVTGTHPNRVVLDVRGAVADIENVFQVTLREYRHPTESRTFYAPDVEPSFDRAVPILHVSGLDNYALPHPQHRGKPMARSATVAPSSGSGPGGGYLGGDFRAAYVPGTALTGVGQSVGLLQFDGYNAYDITAYESRAGLSAIPLQNVLIDGATGYPSGSGDEVEVCLDIEMVASMAPGISKILVYMAPNGKPWVDLLSRMANDNLAKQLSCSWGGGSSNATAELIFQQMAAQGQSFFNASGDADAFTGAIEFPSDSPNITEVGGTTLTTSGAGGPWASETVWNWGYHSGAYLGSSGGSSTYYAIPAWQQGIGMSSNQGSTTMRNVPDVALTADNVYVRADGVDYSEGGTSCAAPLWAGLAALMNQQLAQDGCAPVGFLNPALYAIGTGTVYASCFHDIATGNNFWPGSPAKFRAVTGYDLCTGLGTPNGNNLIAELAAGLQQALEPALLAAHLNEAAGNGNGSPDPGETIQEWLVWTNRGNRSATSVTGTLACGAPGLTFLQSRAAFSDLTPGAAFSNVVPFAYKLARSMPFGTVAVFTNVVTAADGWAATATYTRVIGGIGYFTNYYAAAGLPQAIPDATGSASPGTLYASDIVAAGAAYVDDVNVSVRIDHTWDSDLVVALEHPDGTAVTLANKRGGGGHNYGTGYPPDAFTSTTFDDSAALAIASGSAPFAGVYRPEGALGAFIGKPASGAWRLHISDTSQGDTGTAIAWGLTLVTHSLPAVYDVPPVASNQNVLVGVGATTNLVLAGSDPEGDALTFRIVAYPAQGTLAGTPPAVSYAAAPGYVGTDSFAFVVNDGYVDSAVATVSITAVSFVTNTLTVVSAYGGASPGTVATAAFFSVTESITNSPLVTTNARYVCRGGAVTGNTCTPVSDTVVTLILTNDATLTWTWQASYLLTTMTEGAGTVGMDPGGPWYVSGSNASLTAVAGANAHFVQWSGDTNGCLASGNTLLAPMTQPRTITASFAPDSKTLTVNSSQGGATPGTMAAACGTTLTEWLTNSPVVNGSTQCVCTGAALAGNDFTRLSATNVALTLTNDATLTWIWQTQYLLTATASGPGTVMPGGWCVAGSNAVLLATPGTNAHVAGWLGDTNGCTPIGNTLTAPMSQPRAIAVLFSFDNARTVTVISALGGAVPGTMVAGSGTVIRAWVTNSPVVNGGTQYVCTGGAVAGNAFACLGATNIVLTLTNNAILSWAWQTQYLLTVAAVGPGAVTPGAWLVAGSNAALVATAGTNAHFAGWSGSTNGCVLAGAKLTSPMTQARAISAVFAFDSRTLTVTSSRGGTMPGTTVVGYGTAIRAWVTNSPVANGTTQYVCTGGTVVGNAYTPVSATNVVLTLTNAAALTWRWGTNYWLDAGASGSGRVTAASGWYGAGSKIALAATPGTNWHFAVWTGNTNGCLASGSTVTASMTQARAITAVFAFNVPPVISGKVTRVGTTAGVAGVTIQFSNGGGTAATDSAGNYAHVVPYGWSGAAAPNTGAGGLFAPTGRSFTNVIVNPSGQNFVWTPPPTLAGRVLQSGTSIGVTGVVITASGGGFTALTDTNGNYTLTVTNGWLGTVTPLYPAGAFAPTNRSYGRVTVNQTSQNFVWTPPPVISGKVTKTGTTTAMAGVMVSFSGVGAVATDSSGVYRITVPYNWSGSAVPSGIGIAFTPTNRVYSKVIANQTQNFTGRAAAALPAIALGNTRFALVAANRPAVLLRTSGTARWSGADAAQVRRAPELLTVYTAGGMLGAILAAPPSTAGDLGVMIERVEGPDGFLDAMDGNLFVLRNVDGLVDLCALRPGAIVSGAATLQNDGDDVVLMWNLTLTGP